MTSARTAPTLAEWAIFFVLLAGALLMCGPFIWMISTSLKPSAEVF
jgi:multiple sugar transport system permease protein